MANPLFALCEYRLARSFRTKKAVVSLLVFLFDANPANDRHTSGLPAPPTDHLFPHNQPVNPIQPKHLYFLLLIIEFLTLLLALTPNRCTIARLSQTLLCPSATFTNSFATRSAKFVSRLLSATSKIHWIAWRRRCLTPSGTGIGVDAPPPAMPLC